MENAVVPREWFDRVDAGRTENVTAPQLQSALAVGNLDFPLSVVQQMIRMDDFDWNGTMSFEEFLALNKFLQKVQSVFSTLQRGRGFLSLEEVYECEPFMETKRKKRMLTVKCELFTNQPLFRHRQQDGFLYITFCSPKLKLSFCLNSCPRFVFISGAVHTE
ncbi:uncharacterized protein LOC133916981 [Phragmites australis]|uniref:uncharacterized protein LOC133916981 n=1 Tax=Phragmites australis TaxID=29695 RepID=UPI002D778EC5|nr:uncharacterized protein LOC133916981 [Phragmites australis]